MKPHSWALTMTTALIALLQLIWMALILLCAAGGLFSAVKKAVRW